ncbi:hypothetical protein AOQ84DRAFT_379514 [Glonium stellatum]|uniref:NAD(P)-binding domain-containing protein n=1 Tax=Glonium stellatum TaxID=574774 RepID=A0A8E2EV49_9PEZI|nr:hypothetical protein AOQ84DRAFT_379514 [Glonium stellatum]
MATNKPTLAFFGATGGCAGTALAAALRDGYITTALARNPDKLSKLLMTSHSIPSSTISTQLTIHSGNVKTIADVKRTLISPISPTSLVSTVIFGVGGAPKMQASLLKPFTLDDPHICGSGIATVLAALSELAAEGVTSTAEGNKPTVVAISTTGTGGGKRDVPLLLYPFYHWGLQVPHADKRKMEHLLFNAASDSSIRDFFIVRPTLLTDGVAKGTEKVRAGWEWGIKGVQGREEEAGPQLGYTIGRTDVGNWIFEQLVTNGEKWGGKVISLTY